MRTGLALVLMLSAASFASADPVTTKKLCNGGKWHCFAEVVVDKATGNRSLFGLPQGFGAGDLQDAYHLDTSVDPGATIAIIDAYGYPSLESDLAEYRSTFGLPPCTKANGCLHIINQNGQASPLPGNAPANDDWTGETALDMDMVSAGCPKCKITVIQVDDDFGDNLLLGNDTAANAGVTVASNSWGAPEGQSGNVNTENQHLNHPGMSIFVSSGDEGALGNQADFPTSSDHVISVGGTSLRRATGTLRGWSESAWEFGGSSCSGSIAKPSWQPANSTCAHRATADVSAVGDPQTGLAVFNNGSWQIVGGTSASSPLVAAIFTLTHHTDVTGQFAYENANDFFDVTDGNNGSCNTILCNAGDGWDGPTGIGTPNGPSLAGAKAPTLDVTPTDAMAVPQGFTVDVTCTSNDSATIKQVEISIDGEKFPVQTAPPFSQKIPPTISDGAHVIAVVCTASSLAVSTATVNVNQVASCKTASDCPAETDICFDNACIPGMGAAGGLGADCKVDGDCTSNECRSDGTDHFCVVSCDGMSACPSGFQCLGASGGTSVCWPGGGGGGCDTGHSASTGGSSPAPLLVGLGLAAFVVARRRRRL